MKKIEAIFIARYIKSFSVEGKEHKGWRYSKYQNHEGLLLITKDKSETRLQFHPFSSKEDSTILYKRGLVTTKVKDIVMNENNIEVTTLHSRYIFSINSSKKPKELIENQPIPRLF